MPSQHVLHKYNAIESTVHLIVDPTASPLCLAEANSIESTPSSHKLLIEPDPYYILIVHQPVSDFVDKMILTTKGGSEDIKAQLDEFVGGIFLPKMEDKILGYFHTHVYAEDGFHTQDIGIHRPIQKVCMNFP